jgi:hypothetical protein
MGSGLDWCKPQDPDDDYVYIYGKATVWKKFEKNCQQIFWEFKNNQEQTIIEEGIVLFILNRKYLKYS